jgi:oligoendopeptidase F
MQPAAGVRWDLSALFSSPDDAKIAQSWADSNRRADAFDAKWRGRIKTGQLSPQELAEAITELESLSQQAGKPVTFSHLLFAADSSDPKTGAFLQAQMEEVSQVRIKLMFFDLELQEAPDNWIASCLSDPSLADYRHFIQVSRLYKPHTLSETEERLLEETSNIGSRAWQRLHEEILSNHRFTYRNPESSEDEKLTQEAVLNKLRHENRAVRQAAADALSAGLAEHERTIVFIYNTLLADKKLEDRLRSFANPEDSRHMANELDKSTVDIVMSLCKERGDLVARYYEVKKRILGLDKLTQIDRYAPLFDAKAKKSWDEAREIVRSSFQEFSGEMAARAEEFFDQNWIDAEMRDGKTGGAFCSYLTPDTHPVVLMTYQGTLDNVMTLAHELGHGVHSSLSRKQSYFNYHGTLPLAELASIFGEMLVFENVVAEAALQDKVALYGEKLEGIFASVHRQSAMFRFEQRAHAHRRDKGELTPEDFSAIWQEEIQSMFGTSIELDDQHKRWWLYVSHFFHTPFYVYAYSFGELLTMAVYEKAKQEGPSFAAKYVDVLERGGSESPHELMARLGVDLRDKSFWEGGFAVIDRMVGEFERLWAEYSR